MDLLSEIRQSRMTPFQIRAIVVAIGLILIDGIDVAVMAFAAPSLSREWNVDSILLGYLLSASLFGMAAGSFFLTPLADAIGRRRLTIIAMSVVSVGAILSIFAADPAQLITFRVITGLGIGGMMANLNVLVSEYSSDRRRGSIIAIYTAGYAIGATLGGLVAGPLIPVFGWRSLFVVAAALTVTMFIVSFLYLPESLEFLVARRPANALVRVNDILVKMKRQPVSDLPVTELSKSSKNALQEVLTKPSLPRTIALWVGYAFLVASYYFANTWTPKIMATASGDDGFGVTVGVIVNLGGIVGCFIFSALAIKFRSLRLLTIALVGSAAAYLLFGVIFSSVGVSVIVALFVGMLTNAGIAGFYIVAPAVYSARARGTGVGWMIGIGRLVSIVSPILVGYLLAGGLAPERIYNVFAVLLVISAGCAVALGISLKRGAAAERVIESATISAPTSAEVS